MHEVLPAPCIIRDPRAVHEEHHGKNAQELICKTLNSFHVNTSMASYMGFKTISTCSFLRDFPYTSHGTRGEKKSNASSPTVVPRRRSKHNPTKRRKSSHISNTPSRAYAANAQHGRRAMLTIIQRTDTEGVGRSSTQATSVNGKRARGCCSQSHSL
ncbi:hypothetical protein TcCL_ESM10119 [Trypanosoma cruzi]|nr:hypothetical protein TcCL_ESM10119 [Trypanosoma cruzi]